MDQYYWELTLRDGSKISIPPEGVEVVKRRWDNGQPIHTSRQVIPPGQIVGFEKTARRKTDVPLIEAAAHAFNEPMFANYPNGEEYVVSKWVKMPVTPKEWEKYYSPHHYKRLPDDGGMVMVAFLQPVHQINPQKVSYCTEEEERTLTT